MSTTNLIYEVFDRDAVYDSVFGHSTPAAIFRIGRTCQAARSATKEYVGRAFDIDKHLGRFFSDPFEFRVLQARTEMVVSGSSALQFMDRTVYPHSDMDLYVTSKHAPLVCEWVCTQGGRGYHFVPSEAQAERGVLTVEHALGSYMRHTRWYVREERENRGILWSFYDMYRIRQVLNFKSTDEPTSPVVQVIVSHNTPMESILSFHSTVVMNIITYRAAYALYPKGTFEEGLMVPCDTRDVNHDPGLEKYKERGWTVTNSVAEPFSDPEQHVFVLGKRWVDDSTAWVIPFNDTLRVLCRAGISKENAALVVDPITLNSFSLARDTDRGILEMRFETLKYEFFQSRYTACPESMPKIKLWSKFIREMQMLKLNKKSWDLILLVWKPIFMNECICTHDVGNDLSRFCPAFGSMFHRLGDASDVFLFDGITAT